MSDTSLDDATNSFLLDGDAPRLGAPAPSPVSTESSFLDHEELAPEPDAPVLPTLPALPSLPSLPVQTPSASADPVVAPADMAPTLAPAPAPAVSLPSVAAPVIPTAAQDAAPALPTESPVVATPARHPMAHLMPEKTAPSEASLRAAEIRAAQKAKSRRTKIIVGVVFLAVAGLAGPPLGTWLVDAINEAGSTKTEETPATTAPVTTLPATTQPAADTTGTTDSIGDVDPTIQNPVPTAGLGAAVALPGQAQAVVDQTNADVTALDTGTTAP